MTFRIVVLAIVSTCAALAATPPETVITVTVKNPYDKPLDNAAVIMDFLGSRQFAKLGRRKRTHWEEHTNDQGVAKFPPIPEGTLRVQVIAEDYQTYGAKIDVDQPEKQIEIKLNPPQPQYSSHPPLKPANPAPR